MALWRMHADLSPIFAEYLLLAEQAHTWVVCGYVWIWAMFHVLSDIQFRSSSLNCRIDQCDKPMQNMQNHHDEIIPVKSWGRYG